MQDDHYGVTFYKLLEHRDELRQKLDQRDAEIRRLKTDIHTLIEDRAKLREENEKLKQYCDNYQTRLEAQFENLKKHWEVLEQIDRECEKGRGRKMTDRMNMHLRHVWEITRKALEAVGE